MNVKSSERRKLTATKSSQFATLLLMNIFEPETIGARIAQARTVAGIRQEDLADLIDVSTRSVQGYESGAVKPYRHLEKLAAVLNKPVEWFLHGDPEPLPPDPRLEALREALADEVVRLHLLADGLEAELASLRQARKRRAL